MGGIINFLIMGGSQPPTPLIESVFDGIYTNSVSYGGDVVSSASEFRFTYSGTYLGLKGTTTMYSGYPQFSKLSIIIDNVLWQAVTISDTSLHEFELPVGNKSIAITTSALSKPSSIIGCYINDVIVDSTKFAKINSVSLAEKIVFIGDSITVGANATNPSTEGYAPLFRYNQNKQVAILGYGWGAYNDFASDQSKIDAVIAHLTQLYSGVTTKKFVCSLGTNDDGIYGLSGATIKPWVTALIGQVKIAFPDIIITLISPIIRSDDSALFDGIRTSIGEVATEQSVNHIYGKDILTLQDLEEGLHPTTAGMLKYHNAIYPSII